MELRASFCPGGMLYAITVQCTEVVRAGLEAQRRTAPVELWILKGSRVSSRETKWGLGLTRGAAWAWLSAPWARPTEGEWHSRWQDWGARKG